MLHFDPNKLWNEQYKLLQIIPNLPMEAQGNILENTGKLLIYFALYEVNSPMIPKIVSGLPLINGIIPRTFYLGEEEPEDSKPDRWHNFNNVWWRTDVSHSQAFYILAGLDMITPMCYQARPKYSIFKEHIVKNKYRIMWDKKVVDNGDFLTWWFPVGNHLLRAMCLGHRSLRASLALGTPHMWCKWQDWSDSNNTSFALWYLSKVDKRYERQWHKWECWQDDVMDKLKDFYENNRTDSPDCVKNDLNYLCRLKMREGI